MMGPCALCPGVSREAGLYFTSVRRGERITWELALCESCANRIEKHLKRAVPKRMAEIKPCEHGI